MYFSYVLPLFCLKEYFIFQWNLNARQVFKSKLWEVKEILNFILRFFFFFQSKDFTSCMKVQCQGSRKIKLSSSHIWFLYKIPDYSLIFYHLAKNDSHPFLLTIKSPLTSTKICCTMLYAKMSLLSTVSYYYINYFSCPVGIFFYIWKMSWFGMEHSMKLTETFSKEQLFIQWQEIKDPVKVVNWREKYFSPPLVTSSLTIF